VVCNLLFVKHTCVIILVTIVHRMMEPLCACFVHVCIVALGSCQFVSSSVFLPTVTKTKLVFDQINYCHTEND